MCITYYVSEDRSFAIGNPHKNSNLKTIGIIFFYLIMLLIYTRVYLILTPSLDACFKVWVANDVLFDRLYTTL